MARLIQSGFPVNGTKAERINFLLPYIYEASKTYGVNHHLILTVCDLETSFRPWQTSPKGAQGLMQLMPGTAARFGVSDAYDFRQNISGGTQYLRFLTLKFGGNLDLVLAGYNSGEGNVMKYGTRVPPFAETQGYVARGRVAFLAYAHVQLPGAQAGNLQLNSYSRPRPAASLVVNPVERPGEPVPEPEPPQPTRSIVFGDVAAPTPESSKDKSSQSPGASRVTRSIRFQ